MINSTLTVTQEIDSFRIFSHYFHQICFENIVLFFHCFERIDTIEAVQNENFYAWKSGCDSFGQCFQVFWTFYQGLELIFIQL